MKLREAIKLGHLNIASHKRRSLMVIVVISVIFGLLFAGNMFLQGLEDEIVGGLARQTGGEVYLMVEGAKYARDTGMMQAATDDVTSEDIEGSLKDIRGESLGELPMAGNYLALPPEVAAIFLEVELEDVPEGKVPLIVSLSQASYFLKMELPTRGNAERKLRVLDKIHDEAVGRSFEELEDYYVVGVMPGGGVSSLDLEKVGQNGNPLNVLLGLISVDPGGSYAVQREGLEYGKDESYPGDISAYLLRFANAKEALRYSESKGVCYMMHRNCQEGDLVVQDAFNGIVSTMIWLRMLKMALMILGIVLAVVALIVMYFTVMRLIGQDARVISLYYALGATKRDVGKIYLCYTLELILWALGFAVILAIAMMLILSLVNNAAFKGIFELAYGLKADRVWLIGWNSLTFVLALMMIAMGVVCYFGNYWQFSAKKLAQKLKK